MQLHRESSETHLFITGPLVVSLKCYLFEFVVTRVVGSTVLCVLLAPRNISFQPYFLYYFFCFLPFFFLLFCFVDFFFVELMFWFHELVSPSVCLFFVNMFCCACFHGTLWVSGDGRWNVRLYFLFISQYFDEIQGLDIKKITRWFVSGELQNKRKHKN